VGTAIPQMLPSESSYIARTSCGSDRVGGPGPSVARIAASDTQSAFGVTHSRHSMRLTSVRRFCYVLQ
jgi:hypothetical protein